MTTRFSYSFDHADEYEEIAPCKCCGGRPHSNVAGISCHDCGYEVSRFGKTRQQVIAEWNSDPEDGPRAVPRCVVEISRP